MTMIVWGLGATNLYSNQTQKSYNEFNLKTENHAREQLQSECVGIDVSKQSECLSSAALAAKYSGFPKPDIQAQLDMAKWALWMVWISGIGLLITSIGVIYVAATLSETQRATKAAAQAANQALIANDQFKETSRVQLRAYVGAINVEINKISNGIHMQICIANSGQTPTRNGIQAWGFWKGKDLPPEEYEYPNRFEPPAKVNMGSGETKLINGPTITDQEITEIQKQNLHLIFWGWIEYNDVFDCEKIYRTEVCFRLLILQNREPIAQHWGPFNGADGECMNRA